MLHMLSIDRERPMGFGLFTHSRLENRAGAHAAMRRDRTFIDSGILPDGRPAPERNAGRRRVCARLAPICLALILATPVLAAGGAAKAEGGMEGVSSGTGLSDPSVAVNLSSISGWSTQMPFIDLMRTGRRWQAHAPGAWGGLDDVDLEAEGHVDARGWPVSIPEGADRLGTIWDWDAEDPAAARRKGLYVLRHEGSARFEVKGGGVRELRRQPGRLLFENATGGSMTLDIVRIDPKDPPRRITLTRAEDEALLEAGAVFNPDWIAAIADYRQVRFMDWALTNSSEASEWEDRPRPEDANWSSKGAPVEIMVRLANEIGADPWFTMPHRATDDYVRRFATYVRDHLDPKLAATVEFSNEIWNPAFGQRKELMEESRAAWGDLGKETRQLLNWQTKRAVRVARIWNEVFGAEAKARLVHAIGAQTASPWATKKLLDAALWRKAEPESYARPDEVFDAVAVTTYFGAAVVRRKDRREALLAEIKAAGPGGAEGVRAALAARLQDPDFPSSLPQTAENLREQKEVAAAHGLRMIAYEGGQHVHHLFGVGGKGEALTDFMIGFVRSPQMGALYRRSIEGWEAVGDGPYMQYTDVGAPTKWGSWGLLAHLGDSTPRATAIRAANVRPADWEARGGPWFLQGVTRIGGPGDDTLEGTAQEDYLIGGEGDDTLVGGPGDDGLHGGPGLDVAILSGARGDYSATREGAGLRIVGPDGSDLLVEIEALQFDDGVWVAPKDMLSGAGASGG